MPHGHFRRGDRFLGKAHTLARALSRRSACNHLEIAAVTVMAGSGALLLKQSFELV